VGPRWRAAAAIGWVLPSRRASDTRAGGAGLDIISGDLPAARRAIALRLAVLVRDGEAGRGRARALTGGAGPAAPRQAQLRGNAKFGVAPLPHCADMLSAMENSDFRKVLPGQKSCNKPLHRHTTDRGAPCALYPAVKRSMSRASPVLRNSSTSCDQAKSESASQEQIACRFRAVDVQALW
jgi:hypothetical protein